MILALLAEPGPASACDIWTKSNLGKAALSETNAAYRAGARRESNRSRGRLQPLGNQTIQGWRGAAESKLQ
jgi:hypothetical protein